MGCCASKGPTKVVPYHVQAECCHNSKTNFGNSHSELPLETTESGKQGTESIEKRSNSENSGFKEKNSQVEDGQIAETTPGVLQVVRGGGVSLKEKQVLPNLIRTSGYKDAGIAQPKPVAFEVPFGEDQATPRRYPRRLKKLECAPHLTAELLQQKQEVAERNRCKELQKKADTVSKHRRDLFQAKEHEKLKNAEIQIHTKLLATERNRQNHMKEIVFKQKQREQKARRVRVKASLNNEEEIIHVDETYDSDSSGEDVIWEDEIEANSKESNIQSTGDVDSIDEFFESGTNPSAKH